MNTKELNIKKPTELKDQLTELLKKQFDLRMAKGNGQLTKVNILKEVRRDIARVKTVIRQNEIEKSEETKAGNK